MGIVRKVWEQGHVIRKKKYFGEDAGYLANTNLILRALRKDKTKFSANFQFTLPLRIKTAFLLMKLRKRYLKPIIKPNFPSVRDNPKQ